MPQLWKEKLKGLHCGVGDCQRQVAFYHCVGRGLKKLRMWPKFCFSDGMNQGKQMKRKQVIPRIPARIASLFLSVLAVLLVSAVMVPSARAQAEAQPGKYRCVSVLVAGRAARCQSPSLILNSDGSYQIWGESGTYEVVQQRWLVLSHSKRRGLGYFLTSKEIVFEYKAGGRTCRVTFKREFEPSSGLIDG
jgi:hypothetical protein